MALPQVDASSFIFWVNERISKRLCSEHGAASWSQLLLNGLLMQFSEALCRREIEEVLQQVHSKNIRLVFVFDVNVDVHDDGLKSDTHDDRNVQRQRVRCSVVFLLECSASRLTNRFCGGCGQEYSDQLQKIDTDSVVELPRDAFKVRYNRGLDVLKDVCEARRVECVTAPGEADWHLAFMVSVSRSSFTYQRYFS